MASRRHHPMLFAAVGLWTAFFTAASGYARQDTAEPGQAAAEQLFTLRVLPLLKTKCFGCHGGDPADIRGDFNLLTREGMLKGGESGEPSLVPGRPEASPLYQAVLWEGYEMPPKENDRLTETQIRYLHEWIMAGAPWPNEASQKRIREAEWAVDSNSEGRIVRTSGGTSDEWTYRRYQPADLWAFTPVRSKADLLPGTVPAQQAIDHFINKRIDDAEISVGAPASASVLIRRATLDLTGLPPTPEEIDAFAAAWSDDAAAAWTELIDRLLASPRYGEHWGRHWLDVTRYADTGGMSNDYERSNMWRYRDYVIRAFNDDKPYNQFVIEQLAGDELADRSVP